MANANVQQIKEFKEQYCTSSDNRFRIKDHFNVEIVSYEELLPGNTIRSYATGNREIDGSFIMFKVTDTYNDIIYYPVFSESVGRELVNRWEIQLPSKMTVFTNGGNGGENIHGAGGHGIHRNEDNYEMLHLIQFARSMMILHVREPRPMGEPFKGIYNKLESHPQYTVWECDIKRVNTAIRNFLDGPTNTNKEKFTNLQQYIDYLERRYPDLHLRNFNFDTLRLKMLERYPEETIVF